MDKETASADFLEGDGWSHDYQLAHALLGAARNRDAKKVLELVAAGAPLGDAYCHAHSRSDLGTLQFLLEVCGRTPVNSRSVLGWTPLAVTVTSSAFADPTQPVRDLRKIEFLLSAGADPNRRVVNNFYNETPLQFIQSDYVSHSARTRRLISHLLLRYGAKVFPFANKPYIKYTDVDPYVHRVAAAGGLRAYEKAHRRALATTLTRVAFPCLPVDVVSHVVAFSFHTGYY